MGEESRPRQGPPRVDEPVVTLSYEEILDLYAPRAWRENEARKPEPRRSSLFWFVRSVDDRRRQMLVEGLRTFESVISQDRYREEKRNDFAGKLRSAESQLDMLAEIGELMFLVKRCTELRYAPEFPRRGPDYSCRIDSQVIELEVTKLSGTESSIQKSKLRQDLEANLLRLPSGRGIALNSGWMDTVDKEAVVYQTLKAWLASRPDVGEYELPTQGDTLRVRVIRTDLDPKHTLVLVQSWRNTSKDRGARQFLRVARKKTTQFTRTRPAVIVVWADLEYFPLDWGDLLFQSGFFEKHPWISAVVVDGYDVTGRVRRVIPTPSPNRGAPDIVEILRNMESG